MARFRHGPGAKSIGDRARFYNMCERPSADACWRWMASIANNGYGKFQFAGKTASAHRASFVLHNGPIPSGAVVRHRCDNRWCVNPGHLLAGTTIDNINDRDERGRTSMGERQHLSKLTREAVIAIRADHSDLRILAETYGVSLSTISAARTGYTWKHLNDIAPPHVKIRGYAPNRRSK